MEPVKAPKQRQREEADHEQEQAHMKGHTNPRCLKWEHGELASEARIRSVSSAVKRLGEKSELSTAVNRCTADLRGVFLNTHTHQDGLHAGNDQYGYVALADVHWGDVKLTTIDWTELKRLGDETVAGLLPLEEEEGAQL